MTIRTAARTALAAASALVLAGGAAALTVLDPHVNVPGQARGAGASEVQLPPADLTEVCLTGPNVQREEDGDEEFGDAGGGTRAITTLTLTADADGAAYERLSGQSFPFEGRSLQVENETEPGLVRVPAGDTGAIGAALTLNEAGDARGLSGVTCREASGDGWLLGGATTVGASAELVLVNPAPTTATVTVTPYTERGAGEALAPVAIASGQSERILLDASVADAQRLALHVVSDGGAVAAGVVYSAVTGIEPQGSGIVSPGAGPAATQTIPGVEVDDRAPGVVRILNPGADATRASVTLLGADGPEELPGATDITIDAGAVQDVSLDGVAAGAYAVQVAAEDRVLAAASVRRAGEGGASTTWVPAGQAGRALAVPLAASHGMSSVVHLAAPGEGAEVTLTAADGTERRVRLAAGASAVADLPGAAVTIAADAPVVAAAVVARGDLRAVLPAARAAEERGTVAVRLGDFN